MTIGDKIKFLRKEKGMTQKQLSELSGVQVKTIQRYEYGSHEPTQKTLKKIADAISVPLSYFYEDELPEIKDSVILSDVESELLSLFNSLDHNGKSKLLEYAELLQLKYRKETE